MTGWEIIKALFKKRTKFGGMVVEPAEEIFLRKVPREMWPFELAYSRMAVNSKWDTYTRLRNRKYFTAGWNAAIYCKAKLYVMSEKDLEKLELENARAKNGKN